MNWIALATEDVLTEAIGKRLIQELKGEFQVGTVLRSNGFGYLRKRLKSFCELARHQPVLLITDLDQGRCPNDLMGSWLGADLKPATLLFRVAVREVESWLLADHQVICQMLNKPNLRLPDNPDELNDPKKYLIQLAKKGPRNVREALVPEAGSTSVQGLGYNELLLHSVVPHWSPERAEQRSDSLRRARLRLSELALTGL